MLSCHAFRASRSAYRNFLHCAAIFFVTLICAGSQAFAQTVASDDFETYTPGTVPGNAGAIAWGTATWLSTPDLCQVVTTRAYSGTQSVYSTGVSGSGLWGGFTPVINARCVIYFYDDMGAIKNQYIFMDDSTGNYGIGVAVRTNQVAATWGTVGTTSATKYMIMASLAAGGGYSSTASLIDRSLGWHMVEWIRDDNNTSVALDGVTLKTVPNTQMPDWASYDLGAWTWDTPVGNTPMWFDNASVRSGRKQSAYRWYQNDNAENPTALAALNTSYQGVSGTTYRLRLQASNLDTGNAWAGEYVRLQYREGSNGSWTTLSTASSKWKITNGLATGGNQVTTLLLTGSDVRQHHVESDTSPQIVSVPASQQCEWDFPIVADTSVILGVEYLFRLIVTDSAGNYVDVLTSYPVLASLVVADPSVTLWTGANNTRWTTSGNWSNGVPSATKMAIISSTASNNPDINTTPVYAKGLRIEDGRTLTWGNNNRTLTVNGPVVLTGNATLTQTGSNRNLVVTGATSTIFVEGTWNQGSTGTPVVTAGPTVLAGTWNNTAAGAGIQLNGGLTILNEGVMNFTSTATMTTGGAGITVEAGGILANSSTGTFTNIGAVTLQSNSLWETTAAATYQLYGNFANTGSMVPRTGTASGNFTWMAATASTVSGSGTSVFNNLTNNGAGTLNLNGSGSTTVSTLMYAQSGSISVGGPVTSNQIQIAAGRTITAASGGTLTNSSSFTHPTGTLAIASAGTVNMMANLTLTGGTLTVASGGTLNVAGNFTNNGAALVLNAGSTTQFNGAGAQALGGTGATTFGNLVVNKSAGTLTSSVAVTTAGALSVQSGTFATGTGAVNVGTDFSIASGATLNYTGSAFNVGGGWSNTGGTITGNPLNVTFNSNNSGTIGGTVATTFNNLTVNKTGGTLTQSQDAVVSGNFTATAGTIDVPGAATLTVRGNATRTGAVFTTGPNLIFDQTANQSLTWGGVGSVLGTLQMRKTGGTLTNRANDLAAYGVVINGVGGTMTMIDGGTPYKLIVGAGGLSISNGTLIQGSDLTVSGPYTQTGGTLTASSSPITTGDFSLTGGTFNGAAGGALDVNGNFLQTAGTFTYSGTLNVSGGFVRNGGTLTNPTAIDLVLDGAGSGTLGGTAATTFNTLTVNKTGGTITLDRDIAMVSSLNLTAGTIAPAGFAFTVPGNVTVGAGLTFSGSAPNFNLTGNSNTLMDIATGQVMGDIDITKSTGTDLVQFSRDGTVGNVTLNQGTLDLNTNNPVITMASFTQNGGTVLYPATKDLILYGDFTRTAGVVSGSPNVIHAGSGTVSGLKNTWSSYTVQTGVSVTQSADLHVTGAFTMAGTATYVVSSGFVLNTEGDAAISGTLTFNGAGGGQWVSTPVDPTITIADGAVINLPGVNTFSASQSFVIGKNVTINLNGKLTLNGSVTINGAGSSYDTAEYTTVQGLSGGSYSVVFNHNVVLHYVRFLDLNNGGGANTGVELGSGTAHTTTFDHVLFLSGISSTATSRYLTISGAGRDGATLADVGFASQLGVNSNSTIWRNSGTGSSAITVSTYLLGGVAGAVYVGEDASDNDDGDGAGNNTDGTETLVSWGTSVYPTPAYLTDMDWTSQNSQPVITWTTGTEHRVLGFFLYRSGDGRSWERLHEQLLPAGIEATQTRQYQFVGEKDQVQPGDRLRLAEVGTDLKLRWVPQSIRTIPTVNSNGMAQWPTAWTQGWQSTAQFGRQFLIAAQAHFLQPRAQRNGPQAVQRPVRFIAAAQPPVSESRPDDGRPQAADLQRGQQASYSAEWLRRHGVTPPVVSPALTPSQATLPSPTARPVKFLRGNGLKMTLQQDGVYAIPLSALPTDAKWMMTPGGLQVAKLLDYDGQTRPLQLTTLGGAPALLFYGRGYADAYGNRNVYWFGQFPNDPPKSGTIEAQLRPTTGYYLAQSKHEVNAYYHFNEGGNLNQPNYYDDPAVGLVENTSQNYSLTVSDKTGGTAYLQIGINSYTASAGIAPDHQLNLYVNGTPLSQVTFDGKGYRVLEVPFNAALLVNGANTITLQTPAPVAGVSFDRSLLDAVTLLYPRAYQAVNDELVVDVWANRTVDITGFTSADIRVVDLREIGRERLVPAKVYALSGGGFGVRCATGSQSTRLHFLTAARIKAPDSIAYTTLPANAGGLADYAVVGSAAQIAAVGPLLAKRAAEGLQVLRIDLDQATMQFNYGRFGPHGVQDALRSCNARYVLLLGDTVSDYTFQMSAPSPTGTPAFFVQNQLQGRILTDAIYGDYDGDGRVDAAVGRLPGRTLAAIQAAADKIVAYAPAADAVALVADQVDPYFGLDFKGDLEALAVQLPGTLPVNKIYRQDLASNAAARAALIAALNANTPLVVYEGHAATWALGDAKWFSTTHAAGVTGTATVLAGTCHTAYFANPSADSLGQALLGSPTGAASYVGSVAAANGSSEALYAERLTLKLFEPSAPARIGDAMVAVSRQLVLDDARTVDLVHSYVLLGDPAAPVRP